MPASAVARARPSTPVPSPPNTSGGYSLVRWTTTRGAARPLERFDAREEDRFCKRNSGPLHGVLERAPRLAHVTEPVLRVLESRPVDTLGRRPGERLAAASLPAENGSFLPRFDVPKRVLHVGVAQLGQQVTPLHPFPREVMELTQEIAINRPVLSDAGTPCEIRLELRLNDAGLNLPLAVPPIELFPIGFGKLFLPAP